VITYKLSPFTYYLGRLLVNIPFIGLPNIVVGKAIIKELIQHAASPENLVKELSLILTDITYAEQMRHNLEQVKQQLGAGGGSKNMAGLALEMLQIS